MRNVLIGFKFIRAPYLQIIIIPRQVVNDLQTFTLRFLLFLFIWLKVVCFLDYKNKIGTNLVSFELDSF